MPTVTLARKAMATRFEVVLHGENPVALRAAGEEALDEITRLEARLSLYQPQSEIAQLNARAAREAVRVSPEVFALLELARRLQAETNGVFDITVAPLIRCWGFMHNAGRRPTNAELAAARAVVGMGNVELNPAKFTVRFAREGVMLDLGAIGKGYAIERATEVLREAGVASALLHGGTSTVSAIGHPPDAANWPIAVNLAEEWERRQPAVRREKKSDSTCDDTALNSPMKQVTILLRDESLSVSAASGRQFEFAGRHFGHVVDPRTGFPTEAALLAAVVSPSATETDALATALLTLGMPGLETLAVNRPTLRTMVVAEADGRMTVNSRGLLPT